MAKSKLVISGFEENNRKSPRRAIKKGLVKNIVIALVIVAVLAYAAVQIIASTTNYIGTVNGKKIYTYEYQIQLDTVMYNMTKDLSSSDAVAKAAFWKQVVNGKTNREIAKDKALQNVIEQKVKLSKAAEQGISMDNWERKQFINQWNTQIKSYIQQGAQYGQSTDITKEEYIKTNYNVSYPQFMQQQEYLWIIDKLDTKEKADINPTEDQMKKWYEKDPKKYDQFVTKRIFINYQNDQGTALTGEDLKKKQDVVSEVEKKLTAKGDFGALAAKYTENTSEKSDNGIYKFGEGEADVAAINDWMKTAKAGTYTKLEAKDSSNNVTGVYFVKYESKVTYDTNDEDGRSIRNQIKSEVIGDIYNTKVQGWAKEPQYKINFNGNIYENINVEGQTK